MSWQEMATDAAAAFRLTRLVIKDDLTAPIRDKVIEGIYVAAGKAEQISAGGQMDWTAWAQSDPDPPKLATLLTCPWCAGMWVALGVTVLRKILPRTWSVLARPLALSAVIGLVDHHLDP